MIHYNELRVGNWVEIGEIESLPIQVRSIFDNGINRTESYGYADEPGGVGPYIDYTSVESIKGIPLTPEILEKCGFEWDSNDVAFHKSEEFYLKQTDVSECMLIMHDGTKIGVFINSLHQLQNLFFALTGQELTVNL